MEILKILEGKKQKARINFKKFLCVDEIYNTFCTIGEKYEKQEKKMAVIKVKRNFEAGWRTELKDHRRSKILVIHRE